jgi:uncharacterized membrane protein YgcG
MQLPAAAEKAVSHHIPKHTTRNSTHTGPHRHLEQGLHRSPTHPYRCARDAVDGGHAVSRAARSYMLEWLAARTACSASVGGVCTWGVGIGTERRLILGGQVEGPWLRRPPPSHAASSMRTYLPVAARSRPLSDPPRAQTGAGVNKPPRERRGRTDTPTTTRRVHEQLDAVKQQRTIHTLPRPPPPMLTPLAFLRGGGGEGGGGGGVGAGGVRGGGGGGGGGGGDYYYLGGGGEIIFVGFGSGE